MASNGTPKARALGAELRAARDKAGLGLRELSRRIGVSPSVLSRNETGERAPAVEDVAVILTALDVEVDERERILDLARQPDGGPWLSVGVPEQAQQLGALIEFESTATLIEEIAPLVVPGLLQVGDYTRAIMSGGEVPAAEVGTRVAVRLGRQKVLERPNQVRLRAFIGESVLRGNVGGPVAMAAQLNHLRTMAEWPNVELRIIPMHAPWHPGLIGPFTLYTFSAATPIVHVETGSSGLFLNDANETQVHQRYVKAVEAVALDPEMSIKKVAEEIDRLE